jgi:hypothetical protein
MVNVFPEIFVLGFLIVYLTLLAGLVWWAWRSRIRSGRPLLSFLGILRESCFLLRKPGSKYDRRARPTESPLSVDRRSSATSPNPHGRGI